MLSLQASTLFLIRVKTNIKLETIALCGTRYVIVDIQAPSFTRVNSLRTQSQCLEITAFCKAPPKDKFYLSFWRPSGGLN